MGDHGNPKGANKMADIVTITEEEKALIKPNLITHLDPDSADYADDLLDYGVVHTYPNGVHYITVYVPDFPAMQFSAATGDFAELTDWDYILEVDADAQQEEAEEQEALEEICEVLRFYHKVEYRGTVDYGKVVENRTTLTVDGDTLYQYNCPLQTIYLDDTNYPVTYGRQKVDEDYYYYDFSTESVDPDFVDQYTYRVPYEWKREEVWDE